jgi:hypothetical protein
VVALAVGAATQGPGPRRANGALRAGVRAAPPNKHATELTSTAILVAFNISNNGTVYTTAVGLVAKLHGAGRTNIDLLHGQIMLRASVPVHLIYVSS